MKKYTFKGGIHPQDNKKLTNSIPISKVDAPQFLYFAVNQHIGAPLKPLVSVGDYVKKYQKIADSDAFVSAPLHSSVSGTVIEVGMYPHPSGAYKETILIENDWQNVKADPINTKSLNELTKEEIISIVRQAGIVGMGGASFPTHVKLSPPKDKEIKYIIINGAECEPYLTSDHRVMLESPKEVLYGIKCVMKVFSLDKAYVGIEENKPDAIEKMKEAAKEFDGIEIIKLKKKYPQGSEKHLIYSITKKQVPSGKLPMDVGCVVLNIDTVYSICRAVRDGIPLIKRIITVTGSGINNPANYAVPIGTPVSEIVEKSGGCTDNVSKIIMGGPMMGNAIMSTTCSVLKNTSSLLFLEEKYAHLPKESPCIRCGRCITTCPMHLSPIDLYNGYNIKDFDSLKKFDIFDCIECGCCSYVCPAKRQLVQTIRAGKDSLNRKRAEEKEKNNE